METIYSKFNSPEERLSSFKDNSSPIYEIRKSLSSCGFYATGVSNEAQCYKCHKQYHKWNVAFHIEEIHPVGKCRQNTIEDARETMNDSDKRLSTFNKIEDRELPIYEMRQTLANRGFFATGNGNETKCYKCNGTNNGWNPRSYIDRIHRTLNPNCRILNGRPRQNTDRGTVKDQGTIKPTMESFPDFEPKRKKMKMGPPQSYDSPKVTTESHAQTETVYESSPSLHTEISISHIRSVNESKGCQQCFKRKRELFILPCGDAICFECREEILSEPYICPICKRALSEFEPAN